MLKFYCVFIVSFVSFVECGYSQQVPYIDAVNALAAANDYKTNTLDTTITDVESSANYVDSLETEAETKRVLAIAYLMTNYSLTLEEAITYIAGGYSYQCLALSNKASAESLIEVGTEVRAEGVATESSFYAAVSSEFLNPPNNQDFDIAVGWAEDMLDLFTDSKSYFDNANEYYSGAGTNFYQAISYYDSYMY